jgi:hypothetical protein
MSTQRQPLRIQMIGGPGVGKSSFIGALALLAESPQGGYFVAAIDVDTKRRFDDLRASFRAGHWPPKTSAGIPMRCSIHGPKQRVAIELEDFSGEAFFAAMHRGDDDEVSQRVESLIHDADLLLIMIDGGALTSGGQLSQLPLIQAVAQQINAQHHRKKVRHEPQIAVVITKSDLCNGSPITPRQAKERLAEQLPALVTFLVDHTKPLAWLPVSVCGYRASNATCDAGEFAPAGFDRVFDLLLSLADQPLAHYGKAFAFAVIVALIVSIGLFHYRSEEAAGELALIENPVVRIDDLPAQVSVANEAAYRERIREAALDASVELRSAQSEDEIGRIINRFAALPAAAERIAHDELTALRQQADQRSEELLYARIQDAVAHGNSVTIQQTIDRYLQRYPSGRNAQQARMLLATEEEKRRERAREEIRSIAVWDAASLQRKVQRIADYLDAWGTTVVLQERAEMERAMAAARRMIEMSQYRVTLVRTAGLDRARAHGVRVKVDGKEVALFDGSGTVAEKTWNQDFIVQWRLGMKVDVTLLNFRMRNSDIAYIESRGPMAILALAGTNSPIRYGPDFVSSRPPVTVRFRCEQLDEGTVAAIAAWIFPGNAW